MSRGLSKRRQHFKEVCEQGRPVGGVQGDFISDATGALEIIEHCVAAVSPGGRGSGRPASLCKAASPRCLLCPREGRDQAACTEAGGGDGFTVEGGEGLHRRRGEWGEVGEDFWAAQERLFRCEAFFSRGAQLVASGQGRWLEGSPGDGKGRGGGHPGGRGELRGAHLACTPNSLESSRWNLTGGSCKVQGHLHAGLAVAASALTWFPCVRNAVRLSCHLSE